MKFTPRCGKLGLEILGDQAAGVVRITVWDTGIGISSDGMKHLLGDFLQSDNRAEREYGGIGLGLSLARRLANLLGCTIEAQSEPGRGTRFVVTLPWGTDAIAPGDANPAAAADQSTAAEDMIPWDRVPCDLRERLRAAVLRADLDEIETLAGQLKNLDPRAAREIQILTGRFDYERLLLLLGRES